ncbi:MAG: MmcQ/YjbR family DNA-binding protein [Bacillota bacterium]|nr:MmcQ/YjbR family DNA-binding protein [Bacillota bacterium]
MSVKKIIDYCLSKKGAELVFPFGQWPSVIKVDGRIFAEIYEKDRLKITLKCDPTLAVLLRQKYPDSVIPGYHVPNRNKRFWNTVLLDDGKQVEKEILEMIDHSYLEVVKKNKIKKEG